MNLMMRELQSVLVVVAVIVALPVYLIAIIA